MSSAPRQTLSMVDDDCEEDRGMPLRNVSLPAGNRFSRLGFFEPFDRYFLGRKSGIEEQIQGSLHWTIQLFCADRESHQRMSRKQRD
jgi:hypothetical protein